MVSSFLLFFDLLHALEHQALMISNQAPPVASGRRRLRTWFLMPTTHVGTLAARQDAIEALTTPRNATILQELQRSV